MKRPSSLSAHDLELLSLYLDGALPAEQAARLVSRLQKEVDLRTGLDEIRAVVQALRRLPAVPVPRDFTLRGADAPARRSSAYPVLSLATALATIAFVMVFGLDAWTRAFSFGAQAPLAEPGAPEGQALQVAPSVAERASDLGAEATPTPPVESLMAGSPPATASPAPTSANAYGNDSRLGSPTPTPTVTAKPTDNGAGAEVPPLDLVGILKIGLGALALGLAGATLWVRRRSS